MHFKVAVCYNMSCLQLLHEGAEDYMKVREGSPFCSIYVITEEVLALTKMSFLSSYCLGTFQVIIYFF